ncbi:hypothetical protein [Pararhizobium mangrovi]|uniref:DUF2721 domain-containing protein n=1 Tax=Pararhizobium mangrovi TaxID=2590452 RepID=A0A506TWZ6_9HYPH|nr:hypothetical protein [Pararhizobium mangrovi]TPW26593.1 hypothetical protein FJU11_14120 [Pararhizobium mangrovi]
MPALDEEKLKEHIRAFDRRIRQRNAVALGACAALVLVFLLRAAGVLPGLSAMDAAAVVTRIGDGLLALAAAFVAWQIRRLAEPVSSTMKEAGLLSFHLDQLHRQSLALKSSFLWFATPFLPGLVLVFGGQMLAPGTNPLFTLVGAAVALGVLYAMVVMNVRAARSFDAERRWLEEMERQSLSR